MDDSTPEIDKTSEKSLTIPSATEALGDLCKAMISVGEALVEAFQPIFEIFRQVLKQITDFVIQVYVRQRIGQLYSHLRFWCIPHSLAVIIAYLWITRRYPSQSALDSAYHWST